MSKSEPYFSEEPPNVAEFNSLRIGVGWPPIDDALATKALENSLWLISIRVDHELIGLARVVGGGALYFYLQDFMIEPSHQNKGLGDQIMKRVEDYLEKNSHPGATIGLLAAKGKEAFYQRHGFIDRAGDPWGRGMCKFV